MPDLLTFLGRSPEEAGYTLAHYRDKHTDGRGTGGSTHWSELEIVLEVAILRPGLVPPNRP